VYSPTAILGYGFPGESIKEVLKYDIDIIGVDAGSTDPGPYYLGSGEPLVVDEQVKRDLDRIIGIALEKNAVVVVGSSGGAGSRVHVERTLKLVLDVLGSRNVEGEVKIAVLYSDVTPTMLERLVSENRIIGPASIGAPEFSLDRARESTVVAQNGIEPILRVLEEWKPDIVVAGRVADAAVFAAPLVARGVDRGVAVLVGKILECGAIAAEPGSGSDGMLAFVERDRFYVKPSNPKRRATVVSVAEHALYEREDPSREVLPGGYLDLSEVEYLQVDSSTVEVRGAKWVEEEDYLVKLEGARKIGYRVITIAGARDPSFIANLDSLLEETIKEVHRRVGGRVQVYVRIYGRDAVMGRLEPCRETCHEVGILVEAIAPTPGEAREAVAVARSYLLHVGWPGRKTTAGNLAFPLSPSDIYVGGAYEWSVWHLARPWTPYSLARAELILYKHGGVERGVDTW